MPVRRKMIYIGDAKEDIIIKATKFYADHCGGIYDDEKALAMEIHHSLSNDTWYGETTKDPYRN